MIMINELRDLIHATIKNADKPDDVVEDIIGAANCARLRRIGRDMAHRFTVTYTINSGCILRIEGSTISYPGGVEDLDFHDAESWDGVKNESDAIIALDEARDAWHERFKR